MHLRNDNWVQSIRRYQFCGLGVDGWDNIEMNLKRVNWNQFQVPVTAHREQSMKREKPKRCINQMFIINF